MCQSSAAGRDRNGMFDGRRPSIVHSDEILFSVASSSSSGGFVLSQPSCVAPCARSTVVLSEAIFTPLPAEHL